MWALGTHTSLRFQLEGSWHQRRRGISELSSDDGVETMRERLNVLARFDMGLGLGGGRSASQGRVGWDPDYRSPTNSKVFENFAEMLNSLKTNLQQKKKSLSLCNEGAQQKEKEKQRMKESEDTMSSCS